MGDLTKRVKLSRGTQKVTFCGRLDPLAEGRVIFLENEEVHQKRDYTGLDKEYLFEGVFGVGTDTGDGLGIPGGGRIACEEDVSQDLLEQSMKKVVGAWEEAYPSYSSKTVNGKPLWRWAKEGSLSEIDIPLRLMQVHSLEIKEIDWISSSDLEKKILKDITLVKGDFRQDKIRESWLEYFALNRDKSFCSIKAVAVVSSGTYIRSIVQKAARSAGTTGLAIHIERTKYLDMP